MKKQSVVAAVAALCAPLAAAHASVVWRANFETGDRSQWNGTAQLVSQDRLQVVKSPVAEGTYALKATVIQGDDPIDASGNRNELVNFGREKEGDEYYYRFRVMFDPTFPAPNTWQLFTQWHHSGSSGSPPIEFVVRNEALELVTNTTGGTATRMPIAPLTRGVWHTFILRVKWSSNASVGFVELWHNGTKKIGKRNFATFYAGQSVYMKAGLYRNETIAPTGVLYLDDYVQATTLEEVQDAPAATPPVATTPAPAPTAPGEVPNDEGLELGTEVTLNPASCSASGGAAGLWGLAAFAGLALRRARRRSA